MPMGVHAMLVPVGTTFHTICLPFNVHMEPVKHVSVGEICYSALYRNRLRMIFLHRGVPYSANMHHHMEPVPVQGPATAPSTGIG